jgi:hypothetical protein
MHFFATRADLVPVFRDVESKSEFRYSLCASHDCPSLKQYNSGLAIPTLGQANRESAIACAAYLVTPVGEEVSIEPVRQNAGGVRYVVDQRANSDSIWFQSGGIWTDEILLNGRVVTCSRSSESRRILGIFERRFRKLFAKRQAFYVGAEAMGLKEKGVRLTIGAQSPRDLDLA